MKKATVAYLVGGAALYWWLAKGGKGLKGLGDAVSDFFGDSGGGDMSMNVPSDITVPYQYGAPFYDPSQQQYPNYGYGYPQRPGYGYQQPAPYGSYGYPQYQSPSPYTGQQTPCPSPGSYAAIPLGCPGYIGMAPSNYQTPYTTYPPIQNPSIWSSLFGGSSIFGGVPTPQISAAESLQDSYIQYGLQAGLLQQVFCGSPVAGHSQYYLCTFTWNNARGLKRTGNYRLAANAIKAYQRTGKMA